MRRLRKVFCRLSRLFIFVGFMENVYHEGDRVIVIHSHELHPPALPRKYNEFSHNKIQGNGGGDKLSECEGGM